jgi:endonuclease/exonuclease/phosphatase family metal-dependent hydrolase
MILKLRLTIFFILVVTGMISCQYHEKCPPSHLTSFSVMSFNVGDTNWSFPSADQISQVIRETGPPDILLLQEVRGERQVEQLSQMLNYPNYIAVPYKSQRRVCLAILSMFPIDHPDYLYFTSSSQGSGALCSVVNVGGVPILVCSVHLDQIPSKRRLKNGYVDQTVEHTAHQLRDEIFGDTVRSRSAAELIAWIQKKGYPSIIIGGDFNTIPFSKAVMAMDAAFEDALWPSIDYFTGTYFKINSPLLPRVDYIFHSSDLKAYDPKVIKNSPGDHYPVRAKFKSRINNTVSSIQYPVLKMKSGNS